MAGDELEPSRRDAEVRGEQLGDGRVGLAVRGRGDRPDQQATVALAADLVAASTGDHPHGERLGERVGHAPSVGPADRADGYGIPGRTADGNDALAVYAAAEEAVARARSGEGPTFLHLRTYRFGGHFVGDAEEYRAKDEVAERRELDPIPRLEAVLAGEGLLDAEGCARVHQEVAAEVAEAERFAEESPYPDAAGALEGVFT